MNLVEDPEMGRDLFGDHAVAGGHQGGPPTWLTPRLDIGDHLGVIGEGRHLDGRRRGQIPFQRGPTVFQSQHRSHRAAPVTAKGGPEPLEQHVTAQKRPVEIDNEGFTGVDSQGTPLLVEASTEF